jgi:hypothetical protein
MNRYFEVTHNASNLCITEIPVLPRDGQSITVTDNSTDYIAVWAEGMAPDEVEQGQVWRYLVALAQEEAGDAEQDD